MGNKSKYTLNELTIISADDKKYDIKNVFSEINIYEDIFANCLSGDIEILDANNLIHNIPLIGQEKLTINFISEGAQDTSEEIKGTFAIYKVSDRQLIRGRTQKYRLHFISMEGFRNEQIRVSKFYKGRMDQIAFNIWCDFISDYTKPPFPKEKGLLFEKTRNSTRVVIPNWKPFQAFNWLAKCSVSDLDESSNFLFFETTKNAFYFIPLQQLIKAAKTEDPVQIYISEEANIGKEDVKNLKLQAMESYTIQNQFDTLSSINKGITASRELVLDVNYRKFDYRDYNYFTYFNPDKHLSDKFVFSPNLNEENKRISDYPGGCYRNFYDSSFTYDRVPTLEAKKWGSSRDLSLAEFGMIKLGVKVAGNSKRTVGEVVGVIIPSAEAKEVKEINEHRISGNYLVTAIRHNLSRQDYSMFMELRKDSYNKELEEKVLDPEPLFHFDVI